MADIQELTGITFEDGVTILGEAQFTPMLDKINELVRKVNEISPTPQDIDLTESIKQMSWVKGAINWSTGATASSTLFIRNDYFDISAYRGRILAYSNVWGKNSSVQGMAFYDEDGQYIIGYRHNYGSEVSSFEIKEVEIPSNAATMRMTWYNETHELYPNLSVIIRA